METVNVYKFHFHLIHKIAHTCAKTHIHTRTSTRTFAYIINFNFQALHVTHSHTCDTKNAI